MPDGLTGGGGSGPGGARVPGHLSMLLQELARAPGDDLYRAWQRRLQPGDAVGRFEILREIGRGGFGVVYEALDRQLGRSVAFKTLRPTRSLHELSTDSILREAEAVARLDHPAIVTLYDVGHCASGPYLVEEMLHGETLEQRLRGGPLPARDAVGIGLEVARGLAHAHGRGVLHRDLKPGNLLLTEDGRVKLLDFGLAHLLGTRGLHGAGTPAYMAPEQLRGQAVDARADVFSLGATLFEMLAGNAPFAMSEGRSAVLDPGPPPALPEGTPQPLAALVGRCLARDPVERPASGQAMMEELLAVQRALAQVGQEGGAARAGVSVRRRGVRLALVLAGATLAAAGGVFLVTRDHSAGTAGPASVPPALPSVAVLPFADLSPGKDQEYFADGVAEEILNALSHVEGLHVAGRTSSFSFKGKSVNVQEIGRQLNVRALLEGSVRKEGNRVRITAQVVNVADGYRVWSETYSRELAGIFAVQDEVARAVVEALKVKLVPGKGLGSADGRTTNPESYDYYLIGLYHMRQGTLEGARRSRTALEKALSLDPGNAPAQAALANAIFQHYSVGEASMPVEVANDIWRQSFAAAEKAVAMAPGLADGYRVRGYLRLASFDWTGSRADLDRALALSPDDPRTLGTYGLLLAALGKVTEAIALGRRAGGLDPLSPHWGLLARLYLASGQLPLAQSACDRSIGAAPDNSWARQRQVDLHLLEGRPEAALSAARRIADPAVRLQGIALAENDLGHVTESDRALEELTSKYAKGYEFQIAQVHAWRGDADRALEWLERAYRERDPAFAFVKFDALLRKIRGDPRYTALLEKVNLPVD
jgi:TolB-like protein/tetratricopeptide (TPR) repeat protein